MAVQTELDKLSPNIKTMNWKWSLIPVIFTKVVKSTWILYSSKRTKNQSMT